MASFTENLLSWYRTHRRSLPWRGESDPYRIWLAEVMLQQTQVKTVIPYYHRWIDRFPILRSVAEGSQDDVLKLWEGLGYYSRCRNFHKACRIVVDSFVGYVPSTWQEFRQLPGVGNYTAAAVLSFAFGKPYPVLDGNVNRVMSRLLAFPKPVEKGKKKFIERVTGLMDRDRPGEFNQAMMELGSLVCRKNQPHCSDCPITSFCKGFREGSPERYPVGTSVAPRPHKIIVDGVVWRGDTFLVQKRPEKGLLGGLWELPGGTVKDGEPAKSALRCEIERETGLKVKVREKIGAVNHGYSHFTITLHAYHCDLVDDSGMIGADGSRQWILPEEVARYPFPKANHKLFAILREQGWGCDV